MFMNCGHKVIMTKLRFKTAEAWFPRPIVNIPWAEREQVTAMNVARYKKFNLVVQDLHLASYKTKSYILVKDGEKSTEIP